MAFEEAWLTASQQMVFLFIKREATCSGRLEAWIADQWHLHKKQSI